MRKLHAINIHYKFVASIFLLALLFLGCHTNAYAADIYIPEVLKDTYVYDSASILSSETEKAVNEKLDKLEEDTSAEIVVITIPSLNGIPIEDYANKEFNTLGIGKEDTNNGVLLLISVAEPRVRIEVGKGLEWTLTDSISGRILDNHFVEYRANGDYDTAVIETVDAITELVETRVYQGPGWEEKLYRILNKIPPQIWVCGQILALVVYTGLELPLMVISLVLYLLRNICIALFVDIPTTVYTSILYCYYHILRKDKLPEYEAWLKEKAEKKRKRTEQMKDWKDKHLPECLPWGSSSSDSSWGDSSHSSGSFGGGSSGGGGASR